jgi:hypothetical protein
MPKVTISFYANQELKDALQRAARTQDRSISQVIRRQIANSLDALPPLERAVRLRVGKGRGLGSEVETVSFIIRDWQRLRAQLGDNGGGVVAAGEET